MGAAGKWAVGDDQCPFMGVLSGSSRVGDTKPKGPMAGSFDAAVPVPEKWFSVTKDEGSIIVGKPDLGDDNVEITTSFTRSRGEEREGRAPGMTASRLGSLEAAFKVGTVVLIVTTGRETS